MRNCNEESLQNLCMCGFCTVPVVVFQLNGFPRHDLALLLGTGCGGQQWLWRGSGVRVLIADKRRCWSADAVQRVTRTDFLESFLKFLRISS